MEFHGVPVDMPYIFDRESKGVLIDQSEEVYDFQRWSSRREATTEEFAAAKSWREYLARKGPSNDARRSAREEDEEAIRGVFESAVRRTSRFLETSAGLANGLVLLGFSPSKSRQLVAQWSSRKQRWVERDAPYTFRSIALEEFIRGVVREWPWRAKSRADFIYFHYLPFCDLFATDDRTQSRYAKFWLNSEQRIIDSKFLRRELDELQELYSAEQEVLWEFPPPASKGLFASILDGRYPGWRNAVHKGLTSDGSPHRDEREMVAGWDRKIQQAFERGERVPARHGTKGETGPGG